MINIRKALQEKRCVIGTWLNSGSPIIAELLANCGFHFVCVDAEHSAVDLTETQRLFQAIASGNPDCAALVRLHGLDYAFVKRYLDAGARGVICPLVTTAEQARLLVEAVKYPPAGKRGVGFCRANQYGLFLQREFDHANDEILTAVQIEHIEAVRNIQEIVAVPGIDAVFIGPYDLTASMGINGQFTHPDFIAAKQKILDACAKQGVFVGIHVIQPDPEELIARAKEGYTLLAYSLDITMVMKASVDALKTFQQRL